MSRLLPFVALVLITCAGQPSITDEPEVEPEDGVGETAAPPERAGIGDTVSLTGFEESLEVKVTLKRVLDPAKPAGPFDRPTVKGTRYIAIELTLTNVGSAVYSDSPSNGAVLIDAEDRQYTTWVGANLADCGSLDGTVRLQPGDRRRGCVTFQERRNVVPDRFQFTLESGVADETGEWLISG